MKKGIDILQEVLQERLEEKRRKDMAKDNSKPAQVRETSSGKEKWCPKCQAYHPMDLEHFYKDAGSSTGFTSWCRGLWKKPEKKNSKKKTPEKKAAQKDMVLTLDFSEYDLWYEDLLSAADDKLRTPEMQAIWLISESLYKERSQTNGRN